MNKGKSIEKFELEQEVDETNQALPDGGFGWVVVGVSFMVAFFVFGLIYTYSVLVEHYDQKGLFRGRKESLEYVGTVNIAVVNMACLVTGRLDDMFGHRRCILAGALIYGAGLLLSSFATELWHLILTQGVMLGFSGSLVSIATISAPMQWFDKRRGLASGISMSGCGLGGLVFAPVMTKLLSLFDVNVILRCLALFACLVLLFAAWVIRDQPKVESNVAWYDCSILKKPLFLLLLLANTVATFGYLVPMYKVSEYAQKTGIDQHTASYILSIINGSSSISRVVGGVLADAFGPQNTLIISLLIMGLTCSLQWPLSATFPTLLVFGFIFGFGVGGFVSLPPVVNSKLFGVKGLSSINGWLYFTAAFPALWGVPIATALVSKPATSTSDYMVAIQYAGITAFIGAAIFLLVKFLTNKNPIAKV